MTTVDLGPATLNLTGIRAGDKNEITLRLMADGYPWNVTGGVVTAQARLTKSAATASLTATVTPVDITQGVFSLVWNGDSVRTLLGATTEWKGVWDLQILPQGQTMPITLVEGDFTAVMDVTRVP